MKVTRTPQKKMKEPPQDRSSTSAEHTLAAEAARNAVLGIDTGKPVEQRGSTTKRWRFINAHLKRESIRRNPAAKYAISWAARWPQLYERHRWLRSDFSGMGLYLVDQQYPEEYRRVASRNPANFTIGVLHSESAKAAARKLPNPALSTLKAFAIAKMNEMIHSPSESLSLEMIFAVANVALYEIIFRFDRDAAAIHIAGLSRILAMRGGMRSISSERALMGLIYAVDGLHAYFFGEPRIFERDEDEEEAFGVSQPIRQAVQPVSSGLSSVTLRNHLLLAIGAPFAHLAAHMIFVKKLARAATVAPYGLAPAEAVHRALCYDAALQDVAQLHQSFGLSTDSFSQEDRLRHHLVIEAARRVVLVVNSRLLQLLLPSAASHARLEFNVQSLLLIVMAPNGLGLESHHVVPFWALFVGTCFLAQADPLRERLVMRLRDLCVKHLNLWTWADASQFMMRVWWVPSILNAPSHGLWNEIESR